MRKILIIGCGRSGTKYASQVCQQGGINMGHERAWPGGSASWYATVGDRAASMGRFPIEGYGEARFLHQVRHPVKVISSFQRVKDVTWEYIKLFVPCFSMADSQLRKCMVYWRFWNLLAERKAEWTYRVEALFEEPLFEEFCRRTGIDPGKKKAMQEVARNVNTQRFPYPPVSWGDLFDEDEGLAMDIAEQARRYGYYGGK